MLITMKKLVQRGACKVSIPLAAQARPVAWEHIPFQIPTCLPARWIHFQTDRLSMQQPLHRGGNSKHVCRTQLTHCIPLSFVALHFRHLRTHNRKVASCAN